MHLLYIDETGTTGKKLKASGSDVFVMAGVIVSDEKWRKTYEIMAKRIRDAFDGDVPSSFELHTHELLAPNGAGHFEGWDGESRSKLALDLLRIVADRHHVLLNHVNKPCMASTDSPDKDFEFDWKDPWELSFALLVTMFEDHLRGPGTGTTSSGMVIIDHEPSYLDVVRRHSAYRRSAGGWQNLRKVMEVGYSVGSHSNPLIQLTDLVAYTYRKWVERQHGLGENWPPDVVEFLNECKTLVWERVKYKTLKFSKLKVPSAFTDYAKAVRKSAA